MFKRGYLYFKKEIKNDTLRKMGKNKELFFRKESFVL